MTGLARAASIDGDPAVARYVEKFLRHGLTEFGPVFDPAACERLLAMVRDRRAFGPHLFLSEAEFLADPQYKGVNPMPGRNLLEALGSADAFVEANPTISATLRELLGDGYVLLDKKLVCGVPESWLPDWLVRRIEGNPVNNLGAYVRPEYRDITYFYGIDFHQDIIDWKDRHADFVTLYIYVHPVTALDAPLYVMPGSHRLGATIFPHKLERIAGTDLWRYHDERGRSVECKQTMLVGGAGFAALWHSAILHGTQPDRADRERLSLRYLIAKLPGAAPAAIDRLNATIEGSLSLSETRQDLDAGGAARIRQNTINSALAAG
jgi:hypothetical protein